MATTTSNDFYRNPRLTSIAYAAGILLFFLPFIEIKCSGTSVAQLSGKDMVFGSAPSLGNGMDNFGKAFGNSDSVKTASKTEDKGRVYVTAIIALLLGIGGLFLSLSKTNKNYTAMMIAGIAGAILLIVLIIQVKGDINSEMKTQTGNSDPFNDQFSGMMKVSVAITAWFVICVLSYLAAAFFSYKQKGMVAIDAIPPAGAPQLNIQNPGDQSEFPAAPTGDKDLG
jgi:succinate dehydrogenase hydrophobic anchor subunit